MTEAYKRWTMTIIYRTETGPLVVDFDIDEISEAHDIVERGPDWNSIIDISIQLSDVSEDGVTLCAPIEENPHYDPNYKGNT